LARKLALRTNIHLLTNSIPSFTSVASFDCIRDRLRLIREKSITVDDSTPFAAPAAVSQILLNGATCHPLPDDDRWLHKYDADPQTVLVKRMVQNPAAMTNENLSKIHYVYRCYLCLSLIVIDPKGMLRLNEPLPGTDDFNSLLIVPAGLQNIVFIAFHANPIGGHFNAYRTFTRIRLRFFWPKMYSYIFGLTNKCAGCRLSNPTLRPSSELVYNFPITEPCSVLHIDCYQAGSLKTYDGVSCYLVGACHMTSFGMLESITEANSTTFAAALMKFQLRYMGLSTPSFWIRTANSMLPSATLLLC
jgi:hypothetical protein